MPVEKDTITVEGKVIVVLPGTMFRVEIKNSGNAQTILAHISGKMRKNYVRISTGDRVKMEMSPYDLTKARIVYRIG